MYLRSPGASSSNDEHTLIRIYCTTDELTHSYGDSALSQQIIDISMTEIESMIEPNRVLNDFRWKSVTLVHRG